MTYLVIERNGEGAITELAAVERYQTGDRHLRPVIDFPVHLVEWFRAVSREFDQCVEFLEGVQREAEQRLELRRPDGQFDWDRVREHNAALFREHPEAVS